MLFKTATTLLVIDMQNPFHKQSKAKILVLRLKK